MSMTFQEKIEWCIDQHRNTNHFYDKYLPYEFHLRMVVQVGKDFTPLGESESVDFIDVNLACWGHDLIEDTRTSYNDCKQVLGTIVADIIFAVTNEKGKTRKQRANAVYYKGILETPGALFVKLCDRIANVQYSKITKSKMFEMYKSENLEFETTLFQIKYSPMFEYLRELFV